MGVHRRRRATRRSCGRALSSIVRVVPDVPTLPLDDGFVYDTGDLEVGVGTMVRVPLGGRRVRGWVVALDQPPPPKGLRRILSVSGAVPTFDHRLLTVARWAAQHYVTPLSAVLSRTSPPNLSRESPPLESDLSPPDELSPLPEVTAAAAAGKHVRPHYLLSPADWVAALEGLTAPVLAAGRSVMAVFPTATEAEGAHASLSPGLGDRIVLATGRLHDRDVTAAWDRSAQHPGVMLVGTPRVLFWPVRSLAMAVVVEEGRAGHKEKQTPTWHTRDVLRNRSTVERFPVVFMGRVPTTELVAAGTPVVSQGRAWPLVEIIDRRTDPSLGLFTDHLTAVLQGAARRGQSTFVFTHRHGYAPAFLCAQCRSLRVCERCGSRLDRDGTCARCGHHQLQCAKCEGRRFVPLGAGTGRVTAELGRIVDRAAVGAAGSGHVIEVGTERDLPSLSDVELAVAVDADGLLMGSNYRSAEDALRVLARLAATVGRGRGRRAIIQTTRPDHPVITALRRGDPSGFLEAELDSRAAYDLPPAGDVIVVEVSKAPDWAPEAMAGLATEGATVLGPAQVRGSHRWLLQGADLSAVRSALRPIAHRLREAQATVRVDVDPIEL